MNERTQLFFHVKQLKLTFFNETYVFSDDAQSPNSMSDLLLIKNTKMNEIIVTTNPIANVMASCVVEGFKKILAFNSRQVDSVHVEYLPDFQS